ncbi:MAG: iron chaperone [Monoglobales bacterium]
MWVCPKCGRSFKNTNQSHYCGEKPKTVDEYISAQEEEQQVYLAQVRKAIHEAIPEAEEKISWSMPTFWKQHNIIHFAANKKHIGIYAGVQAVIEFAEQLSPYKTSKGTIQIPYEEPMPLELIGQIALWCYETGNHP